MKIFLCFVGAIWRYFFFVANLTARSGFSLNKEKIAILMRIRIGTSFISLEREKFLRFRYHCIKPENIINGSGGNSEKGGVNEQKYCRAHLSHIICWIFFM